MNLIEWTEDISVNNYLIDSQHKKIFSITNDLIINCSEEADITIISEALHELIKYTKTHFKDEEELLAKHNYPKLNEHKEKHEEFVYEIAMFCGDVMENKENVNIDMIEYLTEWVLNHTSKDDQDYKNYL